MKHRINLTKVVKAEVEKPFKEKLSLTEEVIKHHFEEFKTDKMVVAFSGGKDSTVVLYLLRKIDPEIPVVFNNTGVEYPETTEFVNFLEEEWDLNLYRGVPYKKSFWDCIREYGFPRGKVKAEGGYARCCYYLKERPMQIMIQKYGWKGVYTGLTALESRSRMFHATRKGVCYHMKKWNVCKIQPILYWSEEEVWKFIQGRKIPYNKIYDKGNDRCGCMPCTAFKTWEKQLSQANPKMYQLVQNMMGQRLITQ